MGPTDAYGEHDLDLDYTDGYLSRTVAFPLRTKGEMSCWRTS